MNKDDAKIFIKKILSEIRDQNGSALVTKFSGLRQVDSKVREFKIALKAVNEIPSSLFYDMDSDSDFEANSRRVRLEALAIYCDNALTLLNSNISKQKVRISKIPDISELTKVLPDLDDSLSKRWLDAQKCSHQKCYLASIILMGSVLEGLLLARVSLNPAEAHSSSKAPKDRNGKVKNYNDWNLNTLIDIATDIGWIKSDRGKFGHALRESRNIVHPWAEVTSKANFDEYTCSTSWEVLKASVNDLIQSV